MFVKTDPGKVSRTNPHSPNQKAFTKVSEAKGGKEWDKTRGGVNLGCWGHGTKN